MAAKVLDGAAEAPAPKAEGKQEQAAPKPAAPAEGDQAQRPVRPVRPAPDGGSATAAAAKGGKRRRVVIDSQASRRDSMSTEFGFSRKRSMLRLSKKDR